MKETHKSGCKNFLEQAGVTKEQQTLLLSIVGEADPAVAVKRIYNQDPQFLEGIVKTMEEFFDDYRETVDEGEIGDIDGIKEEEEEWLKLSQLIDQEIEKNNNQTRF